MSHATATATATVTATNSIVATHLIWKKLSQLLPGYNFTPKDMDEDRQMLTYHRMIEAFRFAYARRSWLGDDRTNKNITEVRDCFVKKFFHKY